MFDSSLTSRFVYKDRVLDSNLMAHRLDHVVDGECCDTRASQRFHFYPSLVSYAAFALADSCGFILQTNSYIDLIQWQGVAQRN